MWKKKEIIEPNPQNSVFVQVQSELNISQRKWCDLILHCDTNWKVFRIERDEKNFYDEYLLLYAAFYWDAYLPERVDSRLQRGLPPREPEHVIEARRKKGMVLPFDAL